VLPLEPGGWTTGAYGDAFGTAGIGKVLLNTALFAGGAVAFALPIAVLIAYLTERTDVPCRNAIYVLMFIPLSIPAFATALGWIVLLAPRAGVINVTLNGLLGRESTDGLFNIYSLPGMIFVQGLGIVPSMWLLLTAVLRNMNPALEEAASTSGSSRRRTFRRVTFPLMRPGVAAVLVYYLVAGIEMLELPLALGPNAGVEVLSTRIFYAVAPVGAAAPNYAVAAAFGVLGLVLGVIGISYYAHLMKRGERFSVVSGKAYRPTIIRLGRWRWPAFAFIGAFMMLKVILPSVALIYASFLKFYQPPRLEGLPFTLRNYVGLLTYDRFGKFFVNSFLVSVGASVLTVLLASLVAWVTVRRTGALTRVLNILAFVPLAVPGIISTLAFFLIFIGTPLHGTLFLMTLAFASRYLAYVTRLMQAAQIQIHRELEEAAATSSVSPIRGLLFINLPLLRPAVINGFLWVFVHAAKDFSVGLLLASSSTLLAANLIYGSFTTGKLPAASAMMVVLVGMNMLVVAVGRRYLQRPVT
jgi:iron(III) transport system permease protein